MGPAHEVALRSIATCAYCVDATRISNLIGRCDSMTTWPYKLMLKILICVIIVASIWISVRLHGQAYQAKSIPPTQDSSFEPKQVVLEFWSVASKGDMSQAAKYLTSALSTVSASDDEGLAWANLIYQNHLSLNKILMESIKGDRAIVVVEVSDNKGRTFRLEHNLFKKGRSWKIYATYYATYLSGDGVPD